MGLVREANVLLHLTAIFSDACASEPAPEDRPASVVIA